MIIPPDDIYPIVHLSPEACAVIARALAKAIASFEQWAIPIPETGRLIEAQKWLEEIARRGYYGESDEELLRTGRAVALAVDFYHISITLGDSRDDSLAKEIALSLGGTLEGKTKDATPYEFQSQFWVGTLLAQSGLHPKVLGGKREGKKPDFLIEAATLECAVEVKRPKNIHSAHRAVASAASQLHSFGKPGIIMVDLSGCLDANGLVLPPTGVSARQQIGIQLKPIHTSLRRQIIRYTRSDKYSRIILLMSFARFWSWERIPELQPDAGLHFIADVLPDACFGIVRRQSQRIQDALLKGIKQLTGNEPSYRYRYPSRSA
jgi:hypothetical protein